MGILQGSSLTRTTMEKSYLDRGVKKEPIPAIQKIENGFILNINKPPGWSSFDVVRKIRNITGIRKVGHAGTLDPFATGVLIICTGKATKLSAQFMDLPKEYQAEMLLGKSTDTLDNTGEITETAPVPELSAERIEEVLNRFIGNIRQRIPDYSAAKIGGRRAYKLARQGKNVPERFKNVTIYDIRLEGYREDVMRFTVSCGKGTYIRSLGLDIARKLGTTGHLTGLCRTKIGDYNLNQAVTPEKFQNIWTEAAGNENFLHH